MDPKIYKMKIFQSGTRRCVWEHYPLCWQRGLWAALLGLLAINRGGGLWVVFCSFSQLLNRMVSGRRVRWTIRKKVEWKTWLYGTEVPLEQQWAAGSAIPHKQSNGNKFVPTHRYTREHRLTQKFMSLWGIRSVLEHHSTTATEYPGCPCRRCWCYCFSHHHRRRSGAVISVDGRGSYSTVGYELNCISEHIFTGWAACWISVENLHCVET